MTDMNMKKDYAVPSLNIIELEGEHLLSGSNVTTNVNISNQVTKDDASMTNKKNSWNHTWE